MDGIKSPQRLELTVISPSLANAHYLASSSQNATRSQNMEYKRIYFCEEEDDEYDKGMGESGQKEAKGTKDAFTTCRSDML